MSHIHSCQMGFVYVLRLKQKKWYIGYTKRVTCDQLLDPKTNHGVQWTQIYKPVEVVYYTIGRWDETKELTLEYMHEYGWENVRGFRWCKTKLEQPPRNLIDGTDTFSNSDSESETENSNDYTCHICGEYGHFANRCLKYIHSNSDTENTDNESDNESDIEKFPG